MENKRILFGICGSFCNHAAVLEQLTALCERNDVTAVVSENVYTCSTRFFDKDVFLGKVKDVTKHDIIHTIVEAEKVGPANSHCCSKDGTWYLRSSGYTVCKGHDSQSAEYRIRHRDE